MGQNTSGKRGTPLFRSEGLNREWPFLFGSFVTLTKSKRKASRKRKLILELSLINKYFKKKEGLNRDFHYFSNLLGWAFYHALATTSPSGGKRSNWTRSLGALHQSSTFWRWVPQSHMLPLHHWGHICIFIKLINI